MTTFPLADLHNHLVPGVDDGARDPEEAVAALRALAAQGVERAVVTPHFAGHLTLDAGGFEDRMAQLDAGWQVLRAAAAEHVPGMRVARGQEVMLDTPKVCLSDPRTRIAGGPFVLLEFPGMHVPLASTDVFRRLLGEGWIPLVAHPERYPNVYPSRMGIIAEWRGMGVRMAVNAGSLLGSFGKGPLVTARALLARGWIDVIGSDYHARPRRPLLLRQVADQLVEWGGAEQAKLLLWANPGRVMDGEPPLEVAPLPLPRGPLRAVLRWFGR